MGSYAAFMYWYAPIVCCFFFSTRFTTVVREYRAHSIQCGNETLTLVVHLEIAIGGLFEVVHQFSDLSVFNDPATYVVVIVTR